MTEQTAQVEAPRPSAPEPSATSWFTAAMGETVDLTLGSHQVTIAREISAATSNRIITSLPSEEGGFVPRWEEYALRKTAEFLRGWSLPIELPSTAEGRVEVLRTMRRGQFERLYNRIQGHELARPRRFFDGVLYTKAEYAALTRDEWREGDQADAKKPAWESLLTIIRPEVAIDADSWFLPEDDTITLQLPDGYSMKIHMELTQGQFLSLIAPVKREKDQAAGVADNWTAARRIAMYLVDWTLPHPSGNGTADPDLDTLAELDTSKFSVILATIDAYEEVLAKAREENPTGAQ